MLKRLEINWMTAAFPSPTDYQRLKSKPMIEFTLTTRKYMPLLLFVLAIETHNELHRKIKLLKSAPKTNQASVTIQKNLTSQKKISSQ